METFVDSNGQKVSKVNLIRDIEIRFYLTDEQSGIRFEIYYLGDEIGYIEVIEKDNYNTYNFFLDQNIYQWGEERGYKIYQFQSSQEFHKLIRDLPFDYYQCIHEYSLSTAEKRKID